MDTVYQRAMLITIWFGLMVGGYNITFFSLVSFPPSRWECIEKLFGQIEFLCRLNSNMHSQRGRWERAKVLQKNLKEKYETRYSNTMLQRRGGFK